MAIYFKPAEIWYNYTSNNTRKWLGFWTKWNPATREVIESYDSVRDIQLHDNGAKIRHQNTFIYDDGTRVDTGPRNGPWEYFRDRDCDERGLRHPGYKDARAFFLKNGGGTWTVSHPKKGDIFFMEIFFPCGDIRFSSGLMYDKTGELLRMTVIREDSRCRPSQYWSSDVKVKDSSSFLSEDDFIGTEGVLTSDLMYTVKENSRWENTYWVEDENQNTRNGNSVFNFPDDIAISCPLNLYEAADKSAFHISVCWLYKHGTESEIRQHTVVYGNGEFKQFKQGVYHPKKKTP